MKAQLATESVIGALSAPVDLNLAILLSEYELEEGDLLENLSRLNAILESFGLELVPPIGELGLTDSRVLRRRLTVDPSALAVREIETGEGETLEFKQTLYLDTKSFAKPGLNIEQCKSEDVLLSSLKTIAAFINTNGGTLLVGIDDFGGEICISREYPITDAKSNQSFDGWELFLRSKIDQYFHDGKAINSSIDVQNVTIGSSVVARIVVGKRRRLAVLKWKDGEKLFVRTGNRTVSILHSELEEFFDLKPLYI